MSPDVNKQDLEKILAERFATLPPVVQAAITSADVQAHMRTLAETHKLHVDQWQILENDVMLTLLGFQPVAELADHLEKDLEISHEQARTLSASISEIVFAPIRGEMERELAHPTAQAETQTTIEAMRSEALAHTNDEGTQPTAPMPTPVQPGTPPQAKPDVKIERGPVNASYIGSKSHERRSIEGDPYREQIL
jgi:hypothetical protein